MTGAFAAANLHPDFRARTRLAEGSTQRELQGPPGAIAGLKAAGLLTWRLASCFSRCRASRSSRSSSLSSSPPVLLAAALLL